MEQSAEYQDELLQLARLALTGRRQDIELYIRRLARNLRRSHSDIADKLNTLLVESPTRQSPLKGTDIAVVPVDQDSRLQLARYEYPVQIDSDPIWPKSIRDKLEQIILERSRQADLMRADLLPTRSILFTGSPGVGKSLAARWLTNKLDRALVILDLSAVMSSFLGRTGNNVRYLLDYAKSVNCVLFLDEFDAIAKRRDDTTELGELKRLVTVLLQEIDDWPSTGLLIAATNHPVLLDPAVWRRFEMVLEFPMPSVEQTEEAVSAFLKINNRISSSQKLIKLITLVLDGLSYSEIERELLQVRRHAVMNDISVERSAEQLIRSRIADLSHDQRIALSLILEDNSYSQREAAEITGVSRTTMQAHRKRNPIE